MRASIYCRVSSVAQEEEGTSVQSQLKACQKKAQESGYEVPESFIFMESFSGLTRDRPLLNKLRELIRQKKIDVVVAYSLDRLSRKAVDFMILQEEMEKNGVQLVFVTEESDTSALGLVISHLKTYAHELEVEKFRERSMRGKRTTAAEKHTIPTGALARLYGYTYSPKRSKQKGVPGGDGLRHINEAEAEWVRQMFGWLVDEGMSTTAIANRLNQRKVPNPSGGSFWHRSTVIGLLTNEGYTGKTYCNTCYYVENPNRKPDTKSKNTRLVMRPREEWISIPGATPRLISDQMFEAAQEQLQRNKALSPGSMKPRAYLLHGFLKCAVCHRSYWSFTLHKRYRRYRCAGSLRSVTLDRCANKTWSADKLEELVWHRLVRTIELLADPLMAFQKPPEPVSLEPELANVGKRLANIEVRRQRLWKGLEDTGDEETFKDRMSKLTDEVKRLTQDKLRLQDQIESQKTAIADKESLTESCQRFKTRWGDLTKLTFDQKRQVMQRLKLMVYLDGDNVGGRMEGSIPFESTVRTQTIWKRQQCGIWPD